MITPEQKELADFVKRVHLSLRCKSREIGADKAWEEHLKNEEVLREYALSMKKLAEFWSTNKKSQTDKFLCRIEWVVNSIIEYFENGLLKTVLEKELKKMEIFHKNGLTDFEELKCYTNYNCIFQPPFKLLDVGSCYNPFQKFEFLEVYPIDLYPANPDVKKCNFISITVTDWIKDWFQDDLKKLPSNFFDVVVFSLFLEYLPSPKQRHVAFVNSYECLKTNGLLLIVTPDSKHANANAAIMKKWKIAAAKMGFVQTKLEKLKYLYCMSFRKSVSPKYPSLLYNIKNIEENSEEMFIIPQDSVDYKSIQPSSEKTEDETAIKELFKELPYL